jgi:hypothetical protein
MAEIFCAFALVGDPIATIKHALPFLQQEPLVFLGRMETGERRQGVVERGSNDPRGGVHVFESELP